MPQEGSRNPKIPREALEANSHGNWCKDNKREQEAELWYLEAIRICPGYEHPWFNLGVQYKWQHRWQDSLRCSREAAKLGATQEDRFPSFWNMGIAATALGDWESAREAWKGCGLDVPDGVGPPTVSKSMAPVRLNVTQESPEVVWCICMDPARAIIDSIPLPESGHRRGDTVLIDGEPKGYRERRGEKVPVFEEIILLERSGKPTFTAHLNAPGPDDVKDLDELEGARGAVAEDWGENVRYLCKACSEGFPGARHDHELYDSRGWGRTRKVGISAPDEKAAKALLDEWVKKRPERWWTELKLAL